MNCPKCNSSRIKKEEGPEDFLSHKEEGMPAKRYKGANEERYFCWDCEHKWSVKNNQG